MTHNFCSRLCSATLPWPAMHAVFVLVLCCCLPVAATAEQKCLGEFQPCNATGECTQFECGYCKKGEYRCPSDVITCVKDAASYSQCPGLKGTHLDPTLTVDQRVAYLSEKATLTEMIGQLTNAAPAIQRLGIPAYQWLNDDLHDVMTQGADAVAATVFPEGPALGATFDRARLAAMGKALGVEARATFNSQVGAGLRPSPDNGKGITLYGPNVNLVRDPRWGRNQEVFSEDVTLSSALTESMVSGLQGNDTVNLVGACCKHFVAYDVETNRMSFDAKVDTRSMWEFYLPVFHSCLAKAKAMHAMCSYNALNGVPACAEPRLLNGVLREQWGWDGFVVSDYDAWANIFSTHHYSSNYTEAAAAGLNAGMDQEGGGTLATDQLPAAINASLTSVAAVKTAFGRLMKARVRLGMFDPPTTHRFNYLNDSHIRTKATTALNRDLASAGMVLLKNGLGHDGRPLLPLDVAKFKGKPGSILVTGSNAANARNTLGSYDCGYTPGPDCVNNMTSILGGLRYGGTGLDGGEVRFEAGCSSTACPESDFSVVAQAATRADLCVVVLGLSQVCSNATGANVHCRGQMRDTPSAFEQEGHDRPSIALSGNQGKLATTCALAKPTATVCVLVHGGALGVVDLLRECTALVTVFYPGQQGGAAFADVIFGRVSPAGRTPQTWYSSDSELNDIANMDVYAGKGVTYRYYTGRPTIPFGHGLSYTTFAYSNLKLASTSLKACDTLELSVDVTNTGRVASDEVVQLYVRTPHAITPAPRIRLADFARPRLLAPGETRTQTLTLRPRHRSVVSNVTDFWSPGMEIRPGPLVLFVGGGQPGFTPGVLNATVTVSGAAMLTLAFECRER